MVSRREFVRSAGAFGTLLALPTGCRTADCVGRAYPGWNPGGLDIHFIHTGVGEQTFFVFPDGTTMLVDCGATPRSPEYVAAIPPRPDGSRGGGEWVRRYLERVTDRRMIDYLMVSHWHDDHTLGLPDVARSFAFGRFTDHQYPHRQMAQAGDRRTAEVMPGWIAARRAEGMKEQPFTVGARNEIRLLHDAANRFADSFEIRNLAANGIVWDGRDGLRDCAAEHQARMGRNGFTENMRSAAFRIRYGKFSYFTGGDVEKEFVAADGTRTSYEGLVGAAAGPVDVCKTNHHAYWDAMQAPFVKEVRARVYLSSTWSPNQVNDRNLPIIASRDLYPGERTIYHGFMPIGKREELAGKPYLADFSPAQGHIVVKVAPGGETYDVYTLTAADESMTILDYRTYRSRAVKEI